MSHNPETRYFEIDLERIGRFANLVEAFLKQELQRLSDDIDKTLDELPASRQLDYIEGQAEDLAEHSDELPRVLRNSLVVSAFSRFEHYLNETCHAVERVTKASISVDDLASRGINRAKLYLVKVARIDFPSSSSEWRELQSYRELRNALVHNDAFVNVNSNLENWVSSHPSLRLRGLQVEVSPEFIADSLVIYRAFTAQFDSACADLRLWRDVFGDVETDPAA